MMKYILPIFALILFSCQQPTNETAAAANKSNPPNIVLIIADDMGYSDLSYFGGEIPTPNIDALFEEGVKLNQFYVSPSCSPTRAMLLAGADNHQIGLGTMIESVAKWQKGKPGYDGHLQKRVITFADVLKENGYRNYLTGKWHLGIEPGLYPTDRGFHQAYTMLNGNSFHDGQLIPMPDMWKHNIDPTINHVQNGKPADFPDDTYASDYYTDKIIEYIDEEKGDKKPFMAYLSLITPHFPLQAPKEKIAKYKGKYDVGYQVIGQKRFDYLKEKGLIGKDIKLEQVAKLKPWNSLKEEEQKFEAKKMETFAAMMEIMDDNVGKLVDYLKNEGLYDNTAILFFADNGPAPQPIEKVPQPYPVDNSVENVGARNSFVGIGPNWGHISALPYKGAKGTGFEGGIRGVAAIKLPFKSAMKETDAMIHIEDVYPTLLALAQVENPNLEGGQTVTGKSFLPILNNEVKNIRTSFGMELSHDMANAKVFRKNDFKLVWEAPPLRLGGPSPGKMKPPPGKAKPPRPRRPPGKWKLFNIAKDPSETMDLSKEQPKKMAELLKDYQQYAMANGVVSPPQMPNKK